MDVRLFLLFAKPGDLGIQCRSVLRKELSAAMCSPRTSLLPTPADAAPRHRP
jgi:hypothetical protein